MKSAKTIIINGQKLSLVRGQVARIYHCEKSPCVDKPLRFWRLVAGKEKSTWHALSELPALNAQAQEMNFASQKLGTLYAVPTRDEQNGLRLWRESKRSGTFSEFVANALQREKEIEATPSISEASQCFIAEKRQLNRGREKWLTLLSQRLQFFAVALDNCPLSQVAVSQVQQALQSRELSLKTQKHYACAVRSLFAWWYARENASRRIADKLSNPLEALPLPSVPKLKEPEIVDAKTLRAFLSAVAVYRPDAVPVYALQAFCGLRLSEASRVRWEDLRQNKFVFLSCSITKTQISRVSPLPRVALLWIRKFASKPFTGLLGTPTVPFECREEFFERVKRKCAKLAKIRLPKNALRHSAVSYISALKGQSYASDVCGHSIRTASVFYRASATPSQARAWFNVCP